MFRRVFMFVAVLVAALIPSSAWPRPRAPSAGVVRDSLGGAIPGATIRVVNEATGAAQEAVSDAAGRYRVDDLAPGQYRVEATLDGFEPAVGRGARRRASGGVDRRHADAGSPHRGRGRDCASRRGGDSGGADSGVGAERRAGRQRRRVQRQPREGADPDGSVLLVQSAQLGGHDPRHRLAIRAHQRRHRAGRRSVHRRRLLRAAGRGDARLPRRRAGRGAARTAGDALRQEHDRGRDQRHEQAGRTSRPKRTSSSAYGSFNFVQTKASVSGPLSDKVAARVSFSGTGRDGFVYNTTTQADTNTLNNLGFSGQVLIAPSKSVVVNVIGRSHAAASGGIRAGGRRCRADAAPGEPAVCADRGGSRIHAAELQRVRSAHGYRHQLAVQPGPRRRVGHRRLDRRTGPADLGDGVSLLELGSVQRSRLHRPARDVDLGGAVEAASVDAGSALRRRAVSSPERRDRRLRVQPGARLQSLVQAGAGFGGGALPPGADAAAATPGLLDGYGFDQFLKFRNVSAAAFGQLEWLVTDRLRVLPGLRFNYDQKDVDFNQTVYGGLQTTDPALIALKLSVLAPQAYTADVDDTNTSGQLTVAYKVSPSVNAYGTYSTGFKSVGLNLNGVPTDALGNPVLSAATVKPEDVRHVEFGVKTELLPGVTANFTVFNTGIKDYQTQVVNAQVGVLRGYLANAEKVRVRGAEFDGNARINQRLSLYGARRLYRRHLRLVPRCAAAARRHRRTAGQGHLGLRSSGHLEMGADVRRRVQQPGDRLRSGRRVLRRGRHQLSIRVLVEPVCLALPDRGRLRPDQRAGRFPLERRLVGVRLVAQSARQGVLRVPHGAARQLGSYCRSAGRSPNRWRDATNESPIDEVTGDPFRSSSDVNSMSRLVRSQ